LIRKGVATQDDATQYKADFSTTALIEHPLAKSRLEKMSIREKELSATTGINTTDQLIRSTVRPPKRKRWRSTANVQMNKRLKKGGHETISKEWWNQTIAYIEYLADERERKYVEAREEYWRKKQAEGSREDNTDDDFLEMSTDDLERILRGSDDSA